VPDSTAPMPPGGDATPPDVPDFDLIRPIGQGGFGRVWLARNRTTGRLRAVKVIPLRRGGTTDPAGREITSITRLEANLQRQHPHLLNIHHVGKTAEHLFYVMDLADDVTGASASADDDYRPATLQSRLQSGPLPSEQCETCARQLLDGLASLHRAGMVHRDVKPANCLFVDGQLKLADFGLLTEANPQISRLGTQKYMPPDGRMDARADVYAAGLVIYEMITGLPADSFPRLGERANEIADDATLCLLTRAALGACQPDPGQRFADAQAMLDELTVLRPRISARPVRLRRKVYVNFITVPFEATIYLDDVRQVKPDGSPYTTPCTLDGLPARVHRVVFKHEGLPDRELEQVDFATTRQVAERW